jgi:hypothetical protein
VRLEVVDGDERLAGGNSKTLGDARADDQATDQAGPGCRGHRIQVSGGQVGFRQYAADQRRQMAQMGARGDFRHHAAERGVRLLA